MTQAVVTFGEQEDRVLTIVKGLFGFKTKSEAVNFVIDKYEEELLEPDLRPGFVKELQHLEKAGKFSHYKSLTALRKEIEDA